jgi:hypothetical protein
MIRVSGVVRTPEGARRRRSDTLGQLNILVVGKHYVGRICGRMIGWPDEWTAEAIPRKAPRANTRRFQRNEFFDVVDYE